MRKRILLVALSLILSLLATVGFADVSQIGDPAAYIQALENAMDEVYGGRDAWPQGFDTYLALAKYHSGVDKSYALFVSWASDELAEMEKKAYADGATSEYLMDFIYALKDAMEAQHGFARSWPGEAQSLMSAAFTYTGNEDQSAYYGLPPKDALPREEAIAIARETIQKEYELSDEQVEELGVYSVYCYHEEWHGSPFWSISIGVSEIGAERYYAYITSPGGEILIATRNDGHG